MILNNNKSATRYWGHHRNQFFTLFYAYPSRDNQFYYSAVNLTMGNDVDVLDRPTLVEKINGGTGERGQGRDWEFINKEYSDSG
jgi:hypothetical protein